jgi:hypothetical protein
VWDQLAPLDLAGLPARIGEQVLERVRAEAPAPAAPPAAAASISAEDEEQLLEKAAARALEWVEHRLGQEKPPAAGGLSPDDEEQLVEKASARALEWVEHRLAEAKPAGGAPSGDVEELIEQASARALEWVEDRLKKIEQAGGYELEQAQAAGRAAAQALLDEKLGGGDPSKSGALTVPGAPDKRLVALGREVKALKETVEALQAGGGGAGGAAPTDAAGLLNSVEFREAFDRRINEVLRYIKGDLVPSAVKKAVEQASGSA